MAKKGVTRKLPSRDAIYEEIQEKAYDGKSYRDKLKISLAEELVREGKVKKIGSKYYSPGISFFSTQKEVIEYLLNSGFLRKWGTKYSFVEEIKPVREVPSFSGFAQKVQDAYLFMGGEYRQSVRIMPLIEKLTAEMDIPKSVAEKWILELPRIFLGRVDLRPFPGEKGLKLKDGSEVARIYLERGIVGL